MKKIRKKTYSQRKALKIKLENTLTRRKNITGFKPTTTVANYWFKHLNSGLFNNKLPTVPLYILRMTNVGPIGTTGSVGKAPMTKM